MTELAAIKVPASVWEDSLSPDVSEMQKDLGLPSPRYVKRGRGGTYIYESVPQDVASDLANYLRDRGDLLLANSDPEYEARERGVYRRMIDTGAQIRAQIIRTGMTDEFVAEYLKDQFRA